MDSTQLPQGFISVEEAINEINAFKGDATVPEGTPILDIYGMCLRHRWIQPPLNFRIRYAIWKKGDRKKGEKDHKSSAGSKWVQIRDNYEAETLKRALANKFRELAGQEFDMSNFRKITTAVDPDDARSGRGRPNAHSKTSVGDEIKSDTQVVTGGEA